MKNIKPYFIIIAILAMLFVGCPNDETKSDDDVQNTTQQSKITSLQVAVNEETGTSIDLSQSKYSITDYNAVINKAITINGAGKDFGKADLTADVSGITLKGMSNVKTLTASANIGNGSLKIASSSLTNLNIYGGGSHSIYIEDHTTIDILTVNKIITTESNEYVRLVIDNTVTIGRIIVQSGLLIDAAGDGSVNLQNVEFNISGSTAAPIAVSSKVKVDIAGNTDTVKVVISDKDIPEAALTIHAIKDTDLTTDFVTSVFEILVAPLSNTAKTALEAELDPKLDSAVTEDITIELEDLVEAYGTKHRIVCGNTKGAEGLPNNIIDLSHDYTLPTLTVTGETFIGWSVVTENGTTELTDNILPAGVYTGKITLTVRWGLKTYTVKFNANLPVTDYTGSMADQTIQEGTPTSLTANGFSSDHWAFIGWNSNPYGTGTSYTDEQEVSGLPDVADVVTLYGQWNMKINDQVFAKTGLVPVLNEETSLTFTYLASTTSETETVMMSPYAIGKYEVTQELYQAVISNNPSYFTSNGVDEKGDYKETDPLLRPVHRLSWYNAIIFCNKLSLIMGKERCYKLQDGTYPDATDDSNIPDGYNANWGNAQCDMTANGYRLPTFQEWECAALGGDDSLPDWGFAYSGSNSVDAVAWLNSNSKGTNITEVHIWEVGLKAPNRLGTYDMTGNVNEWCNNGTYSRYYKGGAYNSTDTTRDYEVRRRNNFTDAYRQYYGIRLVCSGTM